MKEFVLMQEKKYLKSAVISAHFHAEVFHPKQCQRISLLCFDNSMKTVIHKQLLYVVLHSWNIPNSQVILSGVVLAPAFSAAKHSVKLDQESAWRPVLISHAAHIDVSPGLSTVKEKAGGETADKAAFFYTACKLQRLWTGETLHIPTKQGRTVRIWGPARMSVCLCVCLKKEHKECVWQRGKQNRCMWVSTRAADTDLTFTQT